MPAVCEVVANVVRGLKRPTLKSRCRYLVLIQNAVLVIITIKLLNPKGLLKLPS